MEQNMPSTPEEMLSGQPPQSPEDPQRQAWLSTHAAHVGKWLMVCFWVRIAVAVVNTLGRNLKISDNLPMRVLTYAVSVCMFLVFWQLGKANRRFRAAAFLELLSIGTIVGFLGVSPDILRKAAEDPGSAILPLAVWFVAAFALYTVECWLRMTACAGILTGVDAALAQKWRALRGWTMGILIALTVTFLLMLPLLRGASTLFFISGGSILLLIAMLLEAIGLLVASIIELIYLYRSAKLFKALAQPRTEEESIRPEDLM